MDHNIFGKVVLAHGTLVLTVGCVSRGRHELAGRQRLGDRLLSHYLGVQLVPSLLAQLYNAGLEKTHAVCRANHVQDGRAWASAC